jgi:dTDP-glucose pyrophosphorylase
MSTSESPTLLVLAAGMGSRYGGLKQIDPVGPNGETILDYSVFDALRAGFRKIVFVIRKDIEKEFKARIGMRFESSVIVEYAFQELDGLPCEFVVPEGRTKPWGTAHAVLMAKCALQGPFAVINADDFYGAGSYAVLARQLQSEGDDSALVGFALRNTLSEFGTVARGVCSQSPDGYLDRVVEVTHIERRGEQIIDRSKSGDEAILNGDEVVSMNMWGLRARIFEPMEELFRKFLRENISSKTAEYYLPAAINQLVQNGTTKVKVLRSNEAWFGVTYREDRARTVDSIQRLISNGCYPQRLW